MLRGVQGAFLRPDAATRAPDFLVTVITDLHSAIQGADLQSVHNLHPALSISKSEAASVLAEHPVHLARYGNVLHRGHQSGPLSIVDALPVRLRRPPGSEQAQWCSEAGSSLVLEAGKGRSGDRKPFVAEIAWSNAGSGAGQEYSAILSAE